jgi:hypothetical protein
MTVGPIVTSRTQQPLTVNALVSDPTVIPQRIVSLTEDQFITDRILRMGGTADGGAVQFWKSSPIFTDDPSAVVNEGAEIPVVGASRGDYDTARTQKHALAVVVTKEMRDRNRVGEVERQIQAVRNTLIRDIDGAFVSNLQAGVTQTHGATAVWSGTSATIRADINAAANLVRQASLAQQANNWFGYEPTDLILNPADAQHLATSTEFLNLLFGQVNPSDLDPNTLDGRDVLGLRLNVSRAWPAGSPFVVERNTIGGYVDEVPLSADPLYVDLDNQTWRTNAYRTTAAFIDQPLAGCWITGA